MQQIVCCAKTALQQYELSPIIGIWAKGPGQSHLTGSVGTCPCIVVLYARAVGMTLT